MEVLKAKIEALRARGAIQLSRKYKMVGVPPELPIGSALTYLDLLRERNPREWQRLEERARESVVHSDNSTHVELTHEEFLEWLTQRGCAPEL